MVRRLNSALYAGICLLLAANVAFGLPPLTQREVIRIADAFALKKGVCLSCYKRPVIRYHKAETGAYWSAYYAPIPSRNGVIAVDSGFSVRVDEASRIAADDSLR